MKTIAVMLSLLLSGCMTYKNIPTVSTNEPSRRLGKLYYNVEGGSLFAGPIVVREEIVKSAPYTDVLPIDKEISVGDYLSVKIEQTPPSVAASAFGYISYSTLTILPFWSTQDGSILRYSLYRNRVPVATKECVVSRGTFVWLPMILVAWVNAITPSEVDAFRACTRDFLDHI